MHDVQAGMLKSLVKNILSVGSSSLTHICLHSQTGLHLSQKLSLSLYIFRSSCNTEMSEKWKLSKKDASSASCSSSSSSKSKFSRSFSTSASSTKAPALVRSSSTKCSVPSSSSSISRSTSKKEKGSSSSITQKYSSIAKEQKGRFYIMRRCVAMLVCWHKHDS
ncbi:hypothetical protein YC2023_097425 [Brassica napus]